MPGMAILEKIIFGARESESFVVHSSTNNNTLSTHGFWPGEINLIDGGKKPSCVVFRLSISRWIGECPDWCSSICGGICADKPNSRSVVTSSHCSITTNISRGVKPYRRWLSSRLCCSDHHSCRRHSPRANHRSDRAWSPQACASKVVGMDDAMMI